MEVELILYGRFCGNGIPLGRSYVLRTSDLFQIECTHFMRDKAGRSDDNVVCNHGGTDSAE